MDLLSVILTDYFILPKSVYISDKISWVKKDLLFFIWKVTLFFLLLFIVVFYKCQAH